MSIPLLRATPILVVCVPRSIPITLMMARNNVRAIQSKPTRDNFRRPSFGESIMRKGNEGRLESNNLRRKNVEKGVADGFIIFNRKTS